MKIVDLTTLIAYAFEEDEYHSHAEAFFQKAETGEFEVCTLDLTALEAECLYLTGKVKTPLKDWFMFIRAILENPKLIKIPLTETIFTEHTSLYKGFKGKHTYYDSFHGAVARALKVPLITTDATLLSDKTIPTENLRNY
jgi:predicted nucleic acid-binding protein